MSHITLELCVYSIDLFSSGIPIRSTLDASVTQQYAALIKSLSDKARSAIRDIDPTNELVFFRLRTKKHEILIAPGLFIRTQQTRFHCHSQIV
jgi:hypothetical protein